MKAAIGITGLLLATQAMADLHVGDQLGEYTVTSIQECYEGIGPVAFMPDYNGTLVAAWQCTTKQAVQTGLKATGIMFHTVGLCSAPVNPLVTVVMSGIGIGINVVEMGVDLAPCDEDPRKKAEEFCRMLESQGYECDPNTVEFEQ